MERHKKSKHFMIQESDDDAISEQSGDIFGSDSEDESEDSDDMSVASEASSDLDPWDNIIEEVFEQCQSQYDTKVQSLMQGDVGLDEIEAKEAVFKDMRPTYRKAIMNVLSKKLLWLNDLKHDPTYKSIKNTSNHLMAAEDYKRSEALKYAIQKRQFLFDNILERYQPPDIEEGTNTDIE